MCIAFCFHGYITQQKKRTKIVATRHDFGAQNVPKMLLRPLWELTAIWPSLQWQTNTLSCALYQIVSLTKTKSSRTVTVVPLDKVRVSARSVTVWAGQAYWYFFFDRLETVPPLLSDDLSYIETVLLSPFFYAARFKASVTRRRGLTTQQKCL